MRHAEREDRAFEKEGKDWISTAARPQDPMLSPKGRLQCLSVGQQLASAGITKILCSPMIRTVISADLIAEQLGFGAKSVCIEKGLVEEAKSFRGKKPPEPRPNWDPLIMPPESMVQFSDRLDLDYVPLLDVQHEMDESVPNTVREKHATLTDRDEVTRARVRDIIKRIIHAPFLDGETVLVVAHGATVLAASRMLEEELPEDLKIKGERAVSCFAQYVPVDAAKPDGPWRSLHPEWRSGDAGDSEVADAKEDQGFDRGTSVDKI